MADSTRTKAKSKSEKLPDNPQAETHVDELLSQRTDDASLTNMIANMIKTSLDEQREFIGAQFHNFECRLEKIQMQLTTNTKEITKLKTEQSELSAKVDTISGTLFDKCKALEEALALQEDRNRRDNLRIINLPESQGQTNMLAFLNETLPVWFPTLAGEKIEIMRAHRIGSERAPRAPPRTVIVKFLRFTDRDRILKAARETPVMVSGQSLRFAADYSNFTVKRRRAFAGVIIEAKKQGFHTFLLYPAHLKLTKGSESHVFTNNKDAEQFLSMT